MNSWWSLSLGDGITAISICEALKEKFAPLFVEAGKPAEMGIFKRHDSEGSLHCEVMAYFSPAAEQLAVTLGASRCVRPLRDGLELLAGDSACWDILFSD